MLTKCMGSAAGCVVYHGPREGILEFFEDQGFALPERKGLPDFLQEICSRNDQEVRLALTRAEVGVPKGRFTMSFPRRCYNTSISLEKIIL